MSAKAEFLIQVHDRVADIGVLARPGSRTSARHSMAAQAMARARLPLSQAGTLALRKPPAWVLLNLPMSRQSSTALRAGR